MSDENSICGIVMPISSIDGCDENHWADVLAIFAESIADAGYEANLVSNADDVGVIHKRIIQNLYENPIVVCDISGKNPNVMFELGMRLAFDKPTIIVKDDETSYSFDTSAIEHIEYPRDLRFSTIVRFKKKLAGKIQATVEKFNTDPEHTTFLKHFGEFKVAKLDKKEVSGQEYILDELKNLRVSMSRLERMQRFGMTPDYKRVGDTPSVRTRSNPFIEIGLENGSARDIASFARLASMCRGVADVEIAPNSDGYQQAYVSTEDDLPPKELISLMDTLGAKWEKISSKRDISGEDANRSKIENKSKSKPEQ